jgi:hypothetical protein
MRVPPGVVIIAPLKLPRNAERAKSEGRAKGIRESAAKGIIKEEITVSSLK